MALTYSIISPVRDEADNLPRLAHSLQRQTQLPQRWVIVESGSRDRTRAVAEAMSLESDWARLLVLPEAGETERGAPIVRSIHAGLESLDEPPDVVVSVDADVTMDVDYFERLLAAFEREPALGIASGTAWELSDRGLGATVRDRWHRLGRHACISMAMPDGGATSRRAPRLGWNRPAQSPCARVGNPRTTLAAVPAPPARRRARWIQMGALARQRRHGPLHGLPTVVSPRPNASPDEARSFGDRADRRLRLSGYETIPSTR